MAELGKAPFFWKESPLGSKKPVWLRNIKERGQEMRKPGKLVPGKD